MDTVPCIPFLLGDELRLPLWVAVPMGKWVHISALFFLLSTGVELDRILL